MLKKPSFLKNIASATKNLWLAKLKEKSATEIISKQYQEFIQSKNQAVDQRFDDNKTTFYPCFYDNTNTTDFEPHYTYHPAWAARILAQTSPQKHVDISSTIKFCSVVSAFIPVDFYDFRPANIMLDGLTCKKANLLQLPFENDSINSLSCMHTLEHIGLGRYGDEIDYNADLKAMAELVRVLAPNGNLLVVVPIGQPKIAFNAHRIYAFHQLLQHFKMLHLVEFSLIPDDYKQYGLIRNATAAMADQQQWGCGCFWFKK